MRAGLMMKARWRWLLGRPPRSMPAEIQSPALAEWQHDASRTPTYVRVTWLVPL